MNLENPIPPGTAQDAPCCGSETDVREDARTSEEACDVKAVVQEKYAAAARTGAGCGCCGDGAELSMIGDAYDGVEGYVAEADLGLGCGLPTELGQVFARATSCSTWARARGSTPSWPAPSSVRRGT